MASPTTSDVDALAAQLLAAACELYGLPRSEFIPARTARAKALRDAGERDAASLVGKLTKPSVVAWAVNAAVRAEPGLASELVDVVAKMQGSGSARASAARHDELIGALVDAARSVLRDADEQTSATRMAAVATAIRSASLAADPAAFLEGRLADDAASSDETLEAALRAGAIATPRRPRSAKAVAGTDADADAITADAATDGGVDSDDEGVDATAEALATRRAEERRIKVELAEAKAAARATKAAMSDAERAFKRAERELEKARLAQADAAESNHHAQELARELAEELATID